MPLGVIRTKEDLKMSQHNFAQVISKAFQELIAEQSTANNAKVVPLTSRKSAPQIDQPEPAMSFAMPKLYAGGSSR